MNEDKKFNKEDVKKINLFDLFKEVKKWEYLKHIRNIYPLGIVRSITTI